jgi:hypothetical protein
MNMFNCFQAVAFYTLLPFIIMWLKQNDYTTGMWFAVVVQVISYVILSAFMADNIKK